MAERTDIAIIGSGPAGMSAAITATARGRSIMLFGSTAVSEKLSKAHQINNYPGFYGKSGEEIAAAFNAHLGAMDISVTQGKVGSIYSMGDYFSMAVDSDVYEASTVILASGVSFGRPLPGEDEHLGRGVSYCATCDGMLYRGRKAAVLAYAPEEEREADFLASIGVKVDYIPVYKDEPVLQNEMNIICGAQPESIEGEGKVEKLVLKDGTELEEDVVFILRSSIAPDKIISGLELDGNHVKVDRGMRTNIPGFFAAGDITGTPYQYVKAAGEGNVAALSAVSYIDGLSRK
ncbi:MAG: NAD(P)/FAD-dependent oxidoreductase [Eubacteriaceae bacterium]|nr:NAD(P)/FAD-dependent oxidoreductase [Eubacteriaceae bacterium]